jgi:hypothetical protein
VLWGLIAIVLWWALRGVPYPDIVQTLGRLSPAQLAVILLVNLLVVSVFTGRWWVILRAQGESVSFPALVAYRLAGFGISYFTPGTQFGGEPLQASLVHRRESVPVPVAGASVALDRAIDLLGNATFLMFGVVVSLRLNLVPASAEIAVIALAAGLLSVPLLYLAAARRGITPVTAFLLRLPERLKSRSGFARWQTAVEAMEAQIVDFCGRRPRDLTLAMAFSLASWLAILAELALMLRFLDLRLTPLETIGVLTASRLAFLVPVPGGLGALEASQILALTALGYSRAEGLSLGLLIRARDLAFGGAGLLLGWWLARGDVRHERPGRSV